MASEFNGLTGSASFPYNPPKPERTGRQRTVWPSDEVYHVWAHGQADAGRASAARVFFHSSKPYGANHRFGSTIYSYGEHFPMARRTVPAGQSDAAPAVYFVNPNRYSVSTARHQSFARRAIPIGAAVFDIAPGGGSGYRERLWDSIESREWQPFADWTREQIAKAAERATAPRIRAATRDSHLREIDQLVSQWRAVHSLFRFRCGVGQVTAPDTKDLESIRAQVNAQREQIAADAERKRRTAERAAAKARRLAESVVLPQWRAGGPDSVGPGTETVTIGQLGYPAVRLDPTDPKRVQTSYGAAVLVRHARAVYNQLNGGTVQPSEPLNGYGVPRADAAGLSIGCHLIPWGEVAAFGAAVGWPKFTPPTILPSTPIRLLAAGLRRAFDLPAPSLSGLGLYSPRELFAGRQWQPSKGTSHGNSYT